MFSTTGTTIAAPCEGSTATVATFVLQSATAPRRSWRESSAARKATGGRLRGHVRCRDSWRQWRRILAGFADNSCHLRGETLENREQFRPPPRSPCRWRRVPGNSGCDSRWTRRNSFHRGRSFSQPRTGRGSCPEECGRARRVMTLELERRPCFSAGVASRLFGGAAGRLFRGAAGRLFRGAAGRAAGEQQCQSRPGSAELGIRLLPALSRRPASPGCRPRRRRSFATTSSRTARWQWPRGCRRAGRSRRWPRRSGCGRG